MPFETIYTDEMVAACDGGEGPLGHPRVYLNLGPSGKDRMSVLFSSLRQPRDFGGRC